MRGWAIATMLAAVVLAACAPPSDVGDLQPTTDATPRCAETPPLATGAAQPAARVPEIGELTAAWVCVYAVGEELTLAAGPASIEDLDGARALVDTLEPADLNQPCTMELGPEYVLHLVEDHRHTRLTIADYGCRWVRVGDTDELLTGSSTVVEDLTALAGL
ncbi:hypothetical protein [Demequina gelatinilytica]|uniref:hypothetical protein n=1 Tax=Demequina gelatinilytica TaxID=1638980 RepID=UPI0007824D4D|nr:hypothetical protein [Demequina gelatinilytica]